MKIFANCLSDNKIFNLISFFNVVPRAFNALLQLFAQVNNLPA
jgi:hypothetical protein